MACRAVLTVLFSTTPTLYALDINPWFNPPFEFHLKPLYEYTHDSHLQTSDGTIAITDYENWTQLSLQVSPWCYWDLQLSLAGASASSWNYRFAEGACMIRYNWMDDTVGDRFTLVTGAKLSFVSSRLLSDIDFFDPAPFNTEFGLTAGKAFYKNHKVDWYSRLWTYLGYGIGNHGHPWFNSYFNWDIRLAKNTTWRWELQVRKGFGNEAITITNPFAGYANLDYQIVNFGANLEHAFNNCFTARVFGLYNLHSKNASENFWIAGVQMQIPFSL